MTNRSRLVLAGAATLVAACQGGAVSDAQRTEITDVVKGAHQALFRAVSTRNTDSVMAYFVGDGLVWADAGMIYPSRDSVTKAVRAHFGGIRSARLTSAEPKVMVLGPDAAVLTTTFREEVTDTAGHTRQIAGAWTAVYHREAGGWKIAHAHESFPLPELAPAPAPRRRS